MRAVDEGGELLLRSEVAVGRGEVRDPVAVVRGAVALDRRCPNGGVIHTAVKPRSAIRARPSDEPAHDPSQAREVAAVEPAGIGRVEAGRGARTGGAAAVVRRVAVRVPVR